MKKSIFIVSTKNSYKNTKTIRKHNQINNCIEEKKELKKNKGNHKNLFLTLFFPFKKLYSKTSFFNHNYQLVNVTLIPNSSGPIYIVILSVMQI